MALDSRWVAGHAQLSRVLRELSRPAEALAAADVALALDGDDLMAMTARTAALRDLRRYDEAAAFGRKVAATFPNSADAHSELGWVLLRRRDYVGAQASFDAGLEIAPRHGGLLGGAIETLLLLNRPDDALVVANKAAANQSGSPTVQVSRGWVLRRLGRLDEALAAFERAIQLNEHHIWGHHGKGVTLASLGRREEALATLRGVVERDPNGVTNARADLERLQSR